MDMGIIGIIFLGVVLLAVVLICIGAARLSRGDSVAPYDESTGDDLYYEPSDWETKPR